MLKSVRRRRPLRLRLESLEVRCLPTIFIPTTFADGGLGSGSLRDAILQANADTGSATDTIELQTGTYQLTIVNTNGQENAGAQGDLDITNTNHPLIIEGTGSQLTFIDASQLQDRVFQIVNPNTQVTFRNLTMQGGLAQDNGTAGALAGTTTAEGGAIFNNGGNLTLNNVTIQNNVAQGGNGAKGAAGTNGGNGQNGGAGQDALGGGIYSLGGSLTISHSTLTSNQALGGNGGTGGTGATFTGTGGSGGQGGAAQGGGLYAQNGTLSLSASALASNQAIGGHGGQGGTGGAGLRLGGTGGVGGPGGAGQGGGIYANNLALTVTGSSATVNHARGGNGGNGGDGGSPARYFTASGGNGGMGATGGAGQGGGIFASGGLVSLSTSTLSGNFLQGAVGGNGGDGGTGSGGGTGAPGGSGGLGQGGGLYATGATLRVIASTIDHNHITAGPGGNGGIGAGGFTTGFSGAGGAGGTGGAAQGGGLYTASSGVTLTNSTIPFSQVQGGTGGKGGIAGFGTGFGFSGAGGPGGVSQGGGIYTASGSIHFLNDTVAQNQALDSIGGLGGNGIQAAGSPGQGGAAVNAAATINARNTIFGEDKASQNTDFFGHFTTAFNNLVEDGTGSNLTNGMNGNIVGTTANPIDPLLGPLTNNGGPTLTMALKANSPAIDTGTATGAPATDQRGDPRGIPPDIGAYESQTDAADIASGLVLQSASTASGKILPSSQGAQLEGMAPELLDVLYSNELLW
jgi:hypothetical protein